MPQHELYLIMLFKHFNDSVLIFSVNSLFLDISLLMTLSSFFLIVKAKSFQVMSNSLYKSCKIGYIVVQRLNIVDIRYIIMIFSFSLNRNIVLNFNWYFC